MPKITKVEARQVETSIVRALKFSRGDPALGSLLLHALRRVEEIRKNEVCSGCKRHIESWYDHADNCQRC